jgi:osmotically-inducible protein OsmY
MFPAQMPKTDPDELLRCRGSSLLSEGKLQERDESSRADTDLAYEVDNALWKEPTLRALDYHNIEIRVRNRMVVVCGHVLSFTNRNRVEEAIRNVGGIAGIKNNLIADDRLLAEVATALGSLEHTYGCKFFTGVSHGVVLLSGTVDDSKTRVLAEQCAASNPNVRGVINSVRVRGGGLDLPDLPFSQPYIGVEFFFLHGISGRVQQVIIDPDNRRVVAMTLQGRFVGQRQDLNSLTNGGSRQPERTLVIPMTAVRYLTRNSGFLNVRYAQRNQYSEFNAADFLVPPGDWKPPYPYCLAEVLFPAKRADAVTQIPGQMESPIAVALAHQVLKDQLLENDSLGG